MERQEKIDAIMNRDKSYDGVFYYGVKSTKIVCNPGCPAKTPLEKNIALFDPLEEALAQGYRPCKRYILRGRDRHPPCVGSLLSRREAYRENGSGTMKHLYWNMTRERRFCKWEM